MSDSTTNYIYATSKDINIFPVGQSRTDSSQSDARVLSEKNLTNLVKNFTNNTSYVVDYANNVIKFVIEGYYVELTNPSTLSKPLYAKLNKDSNHQLYSDKDDTYQGICFTQDEGTLQLLDDNGNVPEASIKRFDVSSIQIDRICSSSPDNWDQKSST